MFDCYIELWGEIVGERGCRGGESRRQKRDSNMEAAI